MGLVKCPDCGKMVSERASACPECGCPSAYFKNSDDSKNNSSGSKAVVNALPSVESGPYNTNIVLSGEKVSFNFDEISISYPIEYKKYTELHGKYTFIARDLFIRSYSAYVSAKDIEVVITNIIPRAKNNINDVVGSAVNDLYHFGIIITEKEFIRKYNINLDNYLESLYSQYKEVKQEENDIALKRADERANRSYWTGGGFGVGNAIKASIKADMLNAGTSMLRSIGDGFVDRSDKRHIERQLLKAHSKIGNSEVFGNALYRCTFDILYGIQNEMGENGIIELNSIPSHDRISSLFEVTIKNEKNPQILFENLIQCISVEPDQVNYYAPIFRDLIERKTDLKAFLNFWNMDDLYDVLMNRYIKENLSKINNPFVEKCCKNAAEILCVSMQDGDKCQLDIKLLKGTLCNGDSIYIVESISRIHEIAIISDIEKNGEEILEAEQGYEYTISVSLADSKAIDTSMLIVDDECFDAAEGKLYAQYKDKEDIVLWNFADSYEEGEDAYFTFVKNDDYVSGMGINFDYKPEDVMRVFPSAKHYAFSSSSDMIQKIGKAKRNKDVEVLSSARSYLEYVCDSLYVMRFYYDKSDSLILVAYLKNVDTSEEKKRRLQNKKECISKLSNILTGALSKYYLDVDKDDFEADEEKISIFENKIRSLNIDSNDFPELIMQDMTKNLDDKAELRRRMHDMHPGSYLVYLDDDIAISDKMVYFGDKSILWSNVYEIRYIQSNVNELKILLTNKESFTIKKTISSSIMYLLFAIFAVFANRPDSEEVWQVVKKQFILDNKIIGITKTSLSVDNYIQIRKTIYDVDALSDFKLVIPSRILNGLEACEKTENGRTVSELLADARSFEWIPQDASIDKFVHEFALTGKLFPGKSNLIHTLWFFGDSNNNVGNSFLTTLNRISNDDSMLIYKQFNSAGTEGFAITKRYFVVLNGYIFIPFADILNISLISNKFMLVRTRIMEYKIKICNIVDITSNYVWVLTDQDKIKATTVFDVLMLLCKRYGNYSSVLSEPTNVNVKQNVFCAFCGKEISSDSKKCFYCGNDVKAMIDAFAQEKKESMSQQLDSSQAESMVTDKIKEKCPVCNTELSEDERFCPVCGKMNPYTKTCAFCGKIIHVNVKFCNYCGKKTT